MGVKHLIGIVSQQNIPLLLSYHEWQPAMLTLICTQKTERCVQFLVDAISIKFPNVKDHYKVIKIKNESSALETCKVVRNYIRERPNVQWVVNLTGGTKPMSIGLYLATKDTENAKMAYMSVDQPGVVTDLLNDSSTSSPHKPDIAEFVACYGLFFKKDYDKVMQAQLEAQSLVGAACMIIQSRAFGDLLELTETERNLGRNKGIVLSDKQICTLSEMVPRKGESGKSIVGELGIEAKKKASRQVIRFLTGGWLELLVWALLERDRESIGIDDILLGAELAVTKHGNSPNDFDVLAIRQGILYCVECKSGDQNHAGAKDVFYKIKAIREGIGALNVQSVLVTTSQDLINKSSVLERAEFYNCQIIGPQDLVDWEADKSSSIGRKLLVRQKY